MKRMYDVIIVGCGVARLFRGAAFAEDGGYFDDYEGRIGGERFFSGPGRYLRSA